MQRNSPAIIIEQNVDLETYPKTGMSPFYPEITIGDLHGNALKLLYFLIKEEILILNEEHYNEFVKIYKASRVTGKDSNKVPLPAVTKEKIEKFKAILAQARINPIATKKEMVIRLGGDEFADRGANDYFTLKIFEKLKQGGVHFVESLWSNHTAELMEAMEGGKIADAKPDISPGFVNSLDSLKNLIKDGVVTEEEVRQLYSESYLPCLKALSYTLVGNEITIYTHAPVGLEVIEQVAKRVGIEYDDSSAKALAETIDKINKKFQEFIANGQLSDLYNKKNKDKDVLPSEDPFVLLMWHRPYRGGIPQRYKPRRAPVHNGYHVNYVHGHDSHEKTGTAVNVVNLDNNLGKFEHRGDYSLVKASGQRHLLLDRVAEEKEEKVQSIQTMAQLIKLVKEDLMAPRLTENVESDSRHFKELSTTHIDQLHQFACEEIDEGQKKIFLRFRESEFPRTALGEARTYKMDARFPLPGKAGEDPSRYAVTEGGTAVRKVQQRGLLSSESELTDREVELIINESIAMTLGVWGMEKFISSGQAEVSDPSKVHLYGLNGIVYDISKPVQQVIEYLRKKAQTKLEEKEEPPSPKKLAPRSSAPSKVGVKKPPETAKIEKLIAESEQIIEKYKESKMTKHSQFIQLKSQAMRVQKQLKKYALIKELRKLDRAVFQSIDGRIEEAMKARTGSDDGPGAKLRRSLSDSEETLGAGAKKYK